MLTPQGRNTSMRASERDGANDAVRAYLRSLSEWSDDELMRGMMSMFKVRAVNTHEYDARMKFWTQLIVGACEKARTPLVDYRTLLRWFQRSNRVPAGLATVMQQMIDDKRLVRVDDLQKSGWMFWSFNTFVKTPASWLYSWMVSPSTSDDGAVKCGSFVVVEVLDDMCAEILNERRRALSACEVDNPLYSMLIRYGELQRALGDKFADDSTLDLVLLRLEQQGALVIDRRSTETNDKLDQLIKFTDSRKDVKVTEVDTHIIKLKQALVRIEREIVSLQEKEKSCLEAARKHYKVGNKVRALQQMRMKKKYEKQIAEKDGVYGNIQELLMKVEESHDQRKVLDAYKSGVTAFKQTLATLGMNPSEIDETMEEINEAMSDHQEIVTAISQGPAGENLNVSNADLEHELDELLAEDMGIDIERLPPVPTEPVSKSPIRAPAISSVFLLIFSQPKKICAEEIPTLTNRQPTSVKKLVLSRREAQPMTN